MNQILNYRSTNFLRFALCALGAFILFLCGVIFPAIYDQWPLHYPEISYLFWPAFLGLASTTIPFYLSLYQAFRLLGVIDHGQAFSEATIRILRNIKYCGLILGTIYLGGMPLTLYMARTAGAPGLIIMGSLIIIASYSVAVLTAILETLVRSAIELKVENELTV